MGARDESRVFYRDGLEERIIGEVTSQVTREGHTVESYTLASGENRYFATLAGSHLCAHGESVAAAIADAKWKDPKQRPSMEALREEIRKAGPQRLITLNEFRLLTGACITGARAALRAAGRDESPMTAKDVRDHVSSEWGKKLIQVLGWEKSV